MSEVLVPEALPEAPDDALVARLLLRLHEAEEALKRYGRHQVGCIHELAPAEPCVCGFAAAVRGASERESK